jgi:hypothetical protein
VARFQITSNKEGPNYQIILETDAHYLFLFQASFSQGGRATQTERQSHILISVARAFEKHILSRPL